MKKICAPLLLLFLLLFPITTGAHATPVSYTPEASSVFLSPPQEIKIRFSESIETRSSSIVLYLPDGTEKSADAKTDPRDQHWYIAPFTETATGTYAVSWQVISADDGHFTKGAFSFSIGSPSNSQNSLATNQLQVIHSSSIPESTTLWLELLGQAIVLASLLFGTWAYKKNYRDLAQHVIRFAHIGTLLVLVGVASYLILKTRDLAELQNIPLETSFKNFIVSLGGRFSLYRALIAVGISTLIFSSKKQRALLIATSLACVMIFLRAQVSHAAASSVLPGFSVVVNFIHLLFKEWWVGGLILMTAVILPYFARAKQTRETVTTLIGFSKATSIAIGIAGITGTYIVWLHLKDFSNIWLTDWGTLFLVLSLSAGILFLLRLYHQLYAERALVKTKGSLIQSEKEAIGNLSHTYYLETFLGIAMLFLTSMMIITTPPLRPISTFQLIQENNGSEISIKEHPFENNQLLITVNTGKQNPKIKSFVASITNSEKGIGPLIPPIEQRSLASYSIPLSAFEPKGTWNLHASAEREGAYDAVADFSFKYPEDLEVLRKNPDDRSFGLFEIALILATIGIACISTALYRYSARLSKTITRTEDPVDFVFGKRGALSFGIIATGTIFVLALMPHGSHTFTSSSFKKLCENKGHFWHEGVPMRNGSITKDGAVLGCSVGQSHLPDEAEYKYFLRPAESLATFTTNPTVIVLGATTTLTFEIKNSEGNAERELSINHEKLVHTMILHEDGSMFSHIHPEITSLETSGANEGSSFSADYVFPKPGAYLIGISYVVRAQAFTQTFTVQVPGKIEIPSKELSFDPIQTIDDYTVSLQKNKTKPVVGKISTLRFEVKKAGIPVRDLEPILGAPLHLAIMSTDLKNFMHVHGYLPYSFWDALTHPPINPLLPHQHVILPNRFGPVIESSLIFPVPGTYILWTEFKHQGRTIPVRFVVEVVQ